jgi:hypothetical protein
MSTNLKPIESESAGEVPKTSEFLEVAVFNQMQERAKRLEGKKRGVSVELFSRVFTKKGETARGVFMGFRKLPNKGRSELIDAVCWMGGDGKMYYNQGRVLVEHFENAGFEFGMDFEIRYDGPKPTDSRIKMYTVFLLKD